MPKRTQLIFTCALMWSMSLCAMEQKEKEKALISTQASEKHKFSEAQLKATHELCETICKRDEQGARKAIAAGALMGRAGEMPYLIERAEKDADKRIGLRSSFSKMIPLFAAACYCPAVIPLLTSAGADVHQVNPHKETPLMIIADKCYRAHAHAGTVAMRDLLEHGVNVNAQDEHGMTVLHHVVNQGSDVDSCNDKIPEHAAEQIDRVRFLLCEFKADPDIPADADMSARRSVKQLLKYKLIHPRVQELLDEHDAQKKQEDTISEEKKDK